LFAERVYSYLTVSGVPVRFLSVSLIAPLPEEAADSIPVTTSLLQLNVVPEVALVGLYVNGVFEQTAGGVSVLDNVGVGFTITVTSCVFVQPFAVRVNTYVTGIGLAVVLVKTSLISALEPLLEPPDMPITAALVQLNVVPAVALVAVKVAGIPEHIGAMIVDRLLNRGVGFTVTVTLCVLVQPFALRVNTYVTGIGLGVVLVKTSFIISSVPLVPVSVMPPTVARLQLKVVPIVALVAV